MGHENKGNNNKLKDFSIVKQILLSSTLGNVWRSVWRICKLMLGCKELSYSSTEQDHVKSVRLRQMVADILCTLLLTKSQQISYQRKACNSASPRKISVFQFWYKWQLTFPSETLTVPIVWIVPDQHKPRSSYKEMILLKRTKKIFYLPSKGLCIIRFNCLSVSRVGLVELAQFWCTFSKEDQGVVIGFVSLQNDL